MQQNAYAKLEKLDRERIFDVIDMQPNQLRLAFIEGMRDKLSQEEGAGITSIVVTGMGGSALSATILKNWLGSRALVPIEIVRGDTLPEYVTNRTLVLVSSYSGNTAETLAAFHEAHMRAAQIITIGRGGKLQQSAESAGVQYLQLPAVSQPRLAVFAGLKAMTCVLSDLKLCEGVDLRRELEDSADFLDLIKMDWSPDREANNLAKEIANSLAGKPVLIYTSPLLQSAGYKWKIDINENAKQMAFSNTFSELNHNEMQGWLEGTRSEFSHVVLHSNMDEGDIHSRIIVTEEVLHQYGYSPKMIESEGQSHIQQLLYTILLGDFVSAYLAILNGVDPTPVKIVEEFKRKLALEL